MFLFNRLFFTRVFLYVCLSTYIYPSFKLTIYPYLSGYLSASTYLSFNQADYLPISTHIYPVTTSAYTYLFAHLSVISNCLSIYRSVYPHVYVVVIIVAASVGVISFSAFTAVGGMGLRYSPSGSTWTDSF